MSNDTTTTTSDLSALKLAVKQVRPGTQKAINPLGVYLEDLSDRVSHLEKLPDPADELDQTIAEKVSDHMENFEIEEHMLDSYMIADKAFEYFDPSDYGLLTGDDVECQIQDMEIPDEDRVRELARSEAESMINEEINDAIQTVMASKLKQMVLGTLIEALANEDKNRVALEAAGEEIQRLRAMIEGGE